jgi:TRAP-type C4-dicarboxylate transport system permease small subunit
MEPKKPIRKVALQHKVLAFCALITFSGIQLFAQNNNSPHSSEITAGEIAMYVSIIVVVIGVAWFFASRQTDKIDKEHREEMSHHAPKKHYEHPNDPHFRKLRKKTS